MINVNNLEAADGFPDGPGDAVSLDGESVEARTARRARSWTPATVSEA